MRASIKESSVQACQLVDTNDQLLCCPTIIASFTTAHNLVLATPSQSYVHVWLAVGTQCRQLLVVVGACTLSCCTYGHVSIVNPLCSLATRRVELEDYTKGGVLSWNFTRDRCKFVWQSSFWCLGVNTMHVTHTTNTFTDSIICCCLSVNDCFAALGHALWLQFVSSVRWMAAEFVSDPFRLRNCATGKYLCVKGKRNEVKPVIIVLRLVFDSSRGSKSADGMHRIHT